MVKQNAQIFKHKNAEIIAKDEVFREAYGLSNISWVSLIHSSYLKTLQRKYEGEVAYNCLF